MKNFLLLIFFGSLCVTTAKAQTTKQKLQNSKHPIHELKKDNVIKAKQVPNSPTGRDSNKGLKMVKTPKTKTTVIDPWQVEKSPHERTHQNCNHSQGHCDPRNLPLSANGKLLSVDGHEVDFRTSGNPKVTNVCGTPRGYVNNNNKSASCSFTVACDDPSNRDAAPTTVKYFQLVWHVMQSTGGGAASNINQTRIDDLMTELNCS